MFAQLRAGATNFAQISPVHLFLGHLLDDSLSSVSVVKQEKPDTDYKEATDYTEEK